MTEPPPFAADRTVLEDAESGFSVIATPDFELSYDETSGTHDLVSEERDLRVRYRRLPAVDPLDAALAFTEGGNLRFELESQVSTPGFARVQASDEYGGRWTIHSEHDETGTTRLVATRTGAAERTPEQRLDDQLVLETVRNSARGGPVLRAGPQAEDAAPQAQPAPAAQPRAAAPQPAQPQPAQPQPAQPQTFAEQASRIPEAIPVKSYESPDQSVTGKVPDEPDWHVDSAGGMLYAGAPGRGELHMGFGQMYLLPGGFSHQSIAQFGMGGGWKVAPFKTAEQALIDHWLEMRNQLDPAGQMANLEIGTRSQMTQTQYGSGGIFQVTYTRAGQPWRGQAAVGTFANPMDDHWRAYFSSISIPADGDHRVWAALLECWQAYKGTPTGVTKHAAEIRAIQKDANAYTYAKLREVNQGMREAYGLAPKTK